MEVEARERRPSGLNPEKCPVEINCDGCDTPSTTAVWFLTNDRDTVLCRTCVQALVYASWGSDAILVRTN